MKERKIVLTKLRKKILHAPIFEVENNKELALLLKISKMNEENLAKDKLDKSFTEEEREKISDLIEQDKLTVRWNDDIPYQDYSYITLTAYGKVQIFKYENKQDVERFTKALEKEHYEKEFLDLYLMDNMDKINHQKKELCYEKEEVYNIDNFLLYCIRQDLDPRKKESKVFKKAQKRK